MADPTWEDTTPLWEETIALPPARPGMAQRSSQFLQKAVRAPFDPNVAMAATSPAQMMGRGSPALTPISQPLSAAGRVVRDNPEGALEALPTIGAVGFGAATGGAGFIPGLAMSLLGGTAGEAYKQAGRSAMGLSPVSPVPPKVPIPFTDIPVPDIPGIPQQASRMITEGGTQALADVMGRGAVGSVRAAAPVLKKLGVEAGRRALGFTKGLLNTPQKMAKATQATELLLNEGRVPMLSTPENAWNRMDELSKTSGQDIGNYLEGRGMGFNPQEAIKEFEKLRPRKSDAGKILWGGEYAPTHAVIDKAIATVRAHGNQPIPFKEANELKTLFQQLAYELKADKGGLRKEIAGSYLKALDDSLAAPVYEAEAVVRPPVASVEPQQLGMAPQRPRLGTKALTPVEMPIQQGPGAQLPALNTPLPQSGPVDAEVVGQMGRPARPLPGTPPPAPMEINMKKVAPDPKALEKFKKDKKLFGAAEESKKALMNKWSSEAGNKWIGLRDAIYLSRGGAGGLTMALANHLVDRYGAGVLANLLYPAGKAAGEAGPATAAALSAALRTKQKKEGGNAGR